MAGKEIFSNKITKGRRTYFFDIKKSEKDDLYLKISESRKTQNGFEHHRLIIFEEDLNDFTDVFQTAIAKFEEFKKSKQTDYSTYSFAKIREKHAQAYLPWSTEDDGKLELLFCNGVSVKELAKIFERKVGAISSRIKKLELKEKYGS